MKFYTIVLVMLASINLVAYEYNSGFISKSELEDLSIKSHGVKINNFSLSETRAWMAKGLVNIKISFSARNKNQTSKHFSAMFVGLDKDNSVLWALNAEPMMATLSKQKTESIESDTYVQPGTLNKTVKVMTIIHGDL